MADKIFPGEEKLWEKISGFDPSEVCKRAGALYDRNTDSYLLKSFGFDFSISLREQGIRNITEKSEILTKRLAYFFNPSILSYLVNAKEIALSGRLIKPENIRGGGFFFQGSHMLPLNKVAERYGEDKEGFVSRGKELGGRLTGYGDVSLELYPLPRVPVTLILWLSDEEFPARMDILFDSTCEIHLPLDIIWSVAMISILIFL